MNLLIYFFVHKLILSTFDLSFSSIYLFNDLFIYLFIYIFIYNNNSNTLIERRNYLTYILLCFKSSWYACNKRQLNDNYIYSFIYLNSFIHLFIYICLFVYKLIHL